jgi:hypothetical protein
MSVLTNLSNWFYERLSDGQVWYTVGSGDATWTLGNKIETLLDNPVTFTCSDILADLFCQFKPLINGKEQENHPIVKMLNNPNPFQSKQDLLKEYIFFKQAEGWVFQYPVKLVGIGYETIYNLNPSKVSYSKDFATRGIFGAEAKEIKSKQFKYEEAHQTKQFDIKDIIPFFDVANGLSDDFLLKSPSRLKTVQRNIRNINAAMDAKHKAIQKVGRFIVSGSQKGANISRPMDPDDKRSIERNFGGYGLAAKKGDIIATNSQVDVHDLSIALSKLGLDDSLMADAMMIVNVFRVPSELFILSLTGTTYENQKTAIVRYIQTVVQKHVDDYCNSLNSFFGLTGNNVLTGTLDHLSVMQYIEEMKADKALKVSAAIRNLSGTNIDPNQFLESQGINIQSNG